LCVTGVVGGAELILLVAGLAGSSVGALKPSEHVLQGALSRTLRVRRINDPFSGCFECSVLKTSFRRGESMIGPVENLHHVAEA
jgi:hypothetical protein